MKNALLGLLLLFATLSSCKKDTPPATLPDTNAQGEYFNCKIDGKYWTYKQAGYTNHDDLTAGKGIITDPGYVITAENGEDFPQTVVKFWMIGTDFPDSDTIELADYSSGNYAEIVGPNTDNANLDFNTKDSSSEGRLIFTKRMANRLEGNFYFDAYRKSSSSVIHITEGRFSIIP